MPPWTSTALTVTVLAALHGLAALLPGPPLSMETNLVLLAANLYVAYCAWLVLKDSTSGDLGLFVAGYLVLFLLVLVLLNRESLFILLIIAYASVYRIRVLLGVFLMFVLSYVVFQPYAFETFAPLTLAWLAIWRLGRSGASRFLVTCLAVGLFFLSLVLLPLVHLIIQDAPQTLVLVFQRPQVQSAIWMSLASSGLATIIVAVFGIPLAYALARNDFRGKGVIESLIDLPILVPHSVVGIALLVLLGPGSPLGEALETAGLTVSGRFAGLVIAQVFVASPFLIKTAMTAFEGVPVHLENVSRTLGASPAGTFWRISVPLASRGIAVGLILCWARAISEFGSVILFAVHPQTAPVLAYQEFLKAGVSESRPIAVLLLLVCLWVFVLLQFGKTFLPSGLRPNVNGGRRT